MPATIGSDTRCGIGARLRAGREQMGVTLLQAAEKLHVDARVLEALEAEDFESFGATVFVRGHMRRYADLVGERPAELLELYSRGAPRAMPDLTSLPKIGPQSDPRKLVVPGLVVLIGFALAGSVWLVLRGLHGAAPGAAASQANRPQVAASTPGTAVTGAVAPVNPASAGTAPAAAATAAPPTGRPVLAPPAAKAPGAAMAGTAASAVPAKARPIEVTLQYSADSFTEVYESGGARLLNDVGAADTMRTVSGTPPLRIVLRNAPGVSLAVNGQAATIPPAAMQGETAQFLVLRSGRLVRVKPRPGGDRN